ncbi:MAG: hypothetical protein LBS36_13560 [Oscillospiraceae bacterium]|nr:hypothetical protein [Oscillospiraceae bacterium]
MTTNKAKEIIFQAQMAAYPNAEHAKTLGGLYALIEELEQYRALGDASRLREQAEREREKGCDDCGALAALYQISTNGHPAFQPCEPKFCPSCGRRLEVKQDG